MTTYLLLRTIRLMLWGAFILSLAAATTWRQDVNIGAIVRYLPPLVLNNPDCYGGGWRQSSTSSDEKSCVCIEFAAHSRTDVTKTKRHSHFVHRTGPMGRRCQNRGLTHLRGQAWRMH
jgi:hypothetical protein